MSRVGGSCVCHTLELVTPGIIPTCRSAGARLGSRYHRSNCSQGLWSGRAAANVPGPRREGELKISPDRLLFLYTSPSTASIWPNPTGTWEAGYIPPMLPIRMCVPGRKAGWAQWGRDTGGPRGPVAQRGDQLSKVLRMGGRAVPWRHPGSDCTPDISCWC